MNIHACRRKIRYATVGAAHAGKTCAELDQLEAYLSGILATPSWQRSLLRALRRALNTLPLTHGAAGDPPTGRHTVVHRMKQAGATPL